MKRTITRLSSILAIITLLFVFGCTEDLYQDENHANQNLKFKHYTKTFDYLTKDKTFINSFNKIPKKQKNVASAELSRTIMENQYGFTILDTPINIMESDSIISYNLLIKSDTLSNDTFFENLVVNTNKFTSETSAFKIKYNSNYSTSFNLEAQIAPIIYNNTESVSSKFGMICHTLHYCLCHETVVGTIYEEPHTPTEACSGNSFVYYAETICINTGGSGTNSDSGSGIYTPSSYYGGGHSGSNIYVNPTPPIINNIKKRKMNFGSQLTQPQKDWLYNTNNVDAQTSIYDYLENSLTNADGLTLPLSVENYSQEAVDFVIGLINHCQTNNLTPQQSKDYIISNIIVKEIDDSALDNCTKGVLTSLKGLAQKNIAKIFTQLDNPKNPFKTKMTIETPPSPNSLANTNWQAIPNTQYADPFNYIIKVNPDYLNGNLFTANNPPIKKPTQLSIARTLIHELIHAYFDSLYDDCKYNNNCTELKEYSLLWEFYVASNNGGDTSDASHTAMAKLYVEIIAGALKEFQTGNSTLNNPIGSDQDYLDLAWYGLRSKSQFSNTPLNTIFNTEYPLGSSKRIRYDRINAAENKQESHFSAGISPKSTPCN